jgi:hypothetical protein
MGSPAGIGVAGTVISPDGATPAADGAAEVLAAARREQGLDVLRSLALRELRGDWSMR